MFKEDVKRAIRIAVRNLLRQMILIGAWYMIVFFIEDWDVATPYVVYTLGFYYYGFSLMDYTNERRRLNVEDSIQFIKQNASLAFVVGGVFALLFLIDYVGVILAPIIGIVAATVAMHMRIDLNENPHKNNPEIIEDDSIEIETV